MKILLDIDGVMVTTPSWKSSEQLPDGFLRFKESAARNLPAILDKTRAEIVLTTTHRINYSTFEWEVLFRNRGINSYGISKINSRSTLADMPWRAAEIKEWVAQQTDNAPFVVIDDDLSINDLPPYIRCRCVLTKPLIGLDEEASEKVLAVLGFSTNDKK